MKRFTAFLLVMVMLLAFIPTASAQGTGLGFGITNGGWIINGSSCTLSGGSLTVGKYTYDVDIQYGDKTCDITIKGSLAGLTAYQYEPYRYARAIEIPFTVANANGLMLNSTYNLNNMKLTMLVDSSYDTERFLVSNISDHISITVTFIDNSYNNYNNYYVNPGYNYGYGYYDPTYGYTNPSASIPGYTYCKACGSYFNNAYGYCSYCFANADYEPQKFTSKIAYLRIDGVEVAGDQYANVAVGNSYAYGSNLVLNIAASNYNDYMVIKNAKDDYVRIRVTPITTYGNTYPAGTMVRPAAPTTYAMLEGTEKLYTTKDSYNFVLDKDSTFCLTLPGIKKLAAAESSSYGLWSDISLFFGADSSDRYNGKLYYQKVARTSYVSGLVVPSNITLEVGDTVTVPYSIENTGFAPLVSWTALNTSAKPIFVNNGNKVTGVNAGVGYLVANFNGQSQTVKVTVKADTDNDAAAGDKYTVTASSLRVRKGPGTSFSTLGKVNKGTIVTSTGVVSADGNWIQINYNGSFGYVSAQYLKAK